MRRYFAISSKRLVATDWDTFVSARENSKLRFPTCLAFWRQEHLPVPDGLRGRRPPAAASKLVLRALIATAASRHGNIVRGQLWVPAPKAEQQVQPRREPQRDGDGAGTGGSAGFGVTMEENGQDGEVLSCRSL